MARLCDLVEVAENNMECVVLKVKEGVQTELVGLGCFDGDETMFRLTKGGSHSCTVFRDGKRAISWEWGNSGHTLVCDSLYQCGNMVKSCISDDFGIYMLPKEWRRSMSKKAIGGKARITATRNNTPMVSSGAMMIAYGDPKLQDVITGVENVDTMTAYINVETPTGTVALKRTSEDGIVAGISFTIKGDAILAGVVYGIYKGEELVDT